MQGLEAGGQGKQGGRLVRQAAAITAQGTAFWPGLPWAGSWAWGWGYWVLCQEAS